MNEALLGLVFLAGAILKTADINLFLVQISYYGVVKAQHLVEISALGTLALETCLGMCLILGLRFRGLTYAVILVLLIGFSGLILYGWIFHGLKDCGCFGPIEISPGVSIGKNVLLALLTLGAWFGYLRSDVAVGSPKIRLIKSAATAMALISLPAYGWLTMEPVIDRDRPFAQFSFSGDYGDIDLSAGEHFVAVLNMTCEHCKESVEKLNELMMQAGLPPMTALCYEEHAGALDEFRNETGATFPMYSLRERIRTYASLIGAAPPRFYLVRDGRPVKYWDDNVPEVEEVLAAQSETE